MKTLRKNSLRLLFLGLILIALTFAINVKGVDAIVTSDDIEVIGAQVRTVEPNGLAFVGEITNPEQYEAGVEYGVLLSRGKVDASEYDNFVVDAKINGYSTINKSVSELDENNQFRVTLIDIPEEYYSLEYSARAFVKLLDGSYVYATLPVDRSYYGVAKAAMDGGDTNGVIADISKTRVNYALDGAVWNDLTISTYYATYEAAADALLADYNAYATKTYTKDQFYALGRDTEIGTISNMLYNATYKTKWMWLVNHIATIAGSANKSAYQNFYKYTTQSGLSAANTNYIYAIAYEMRGFVGGAQYTNNSSYLTAVYSNATIQENLIAINRDNEKTVFAYNGEVSSFPTPIKNAYTLEGWYDNSGLTGSKVTSIPANSGVVNLYPKYTPVDYSIDFETGIGSFETTPIDSYNIESSEIILPTNLIIAGGTFKAWYASADYSGTPVTSIKTGTYGNQKFYAKWDMDIKSISVTSTDESTNTYDSFSDITFKAGDIITVAAGTYGGNFTVSAANVKIYGPNKDVPGSSPSRVEEAIFTGVVKANASGVEINGFASSGTGRFEIGTSNVTLKCLKINNSDVVTANQGMISYTAAVTSGLIDNCYLKASSTSKGIISDYSVNGITISNNYVEGVQLSAVSPYTDGIRFDNIAGTLNIIGNTVIGFDQWTMALGYDANTATLINIINNSFSSGGNSGPAVTIRRSTANLTVNVQYNTFSNSKGTTVLDFRGTIGSNKYDISYNKFLDTKSTIVYLISSTVAEPFNVHHNYFALATTATNVFVNGTGYISDTYANVEDVPGYPQP